MEYAWGTEDLGTVSIFEYHQISNISHIIPKFYVSRLVLQLSIEFIEARC